MAVHASSPRSDGTNAKTTYERLHEGLDLVLALMLKGDDAVPEALALDATRATSPFDAWVAVRTIAAERQTSMANKRAERRQRSAKNKTKKKRKDAAAAHEAVVAPEQEQSLRIVIKPVGAKVKKEEPKKVMNEHAAPVVKMLDLSGANLSPVMTHAKAPSRKNGAVSPQGNPHNVAVDALPPLAQTPADSPRLDTLTRLRRLPLLEELEPTSTKYLQIVKWLESDDGKNQRMSSDLSSLINKLQKNGVVVSTNGINGNASPKRLLELGAETLDDRLKKEWILERKSGKGTKGGTKREPKRRKSTGTASRKRKLGGFVAESDEEEYEDGAWAQDSEGEYQSGEDASSSDGEVDDEVDTDPVPEVTESDTDVRKERTQPARSVNGASSASPRKVTPPASTKASPKSTPRAAQSPAVEPDQVSLTGREQLASVAAKIRQLDEPTYLSYSKPTPDAAIKQEASPAAPSTPKPRVPLAKEGTSESNAIVLDDSDDEDEGGATQDMAPAPRAPKSTAPASPKAPTKQQRATPPKQAKPVSSVAPKVAGKGKAKAAAPASGKRKNAVKSEEEESDADEDGEAEFVPAGEDEDSATEGEEDMFDLNEEDVYVVESILEVKKGRTLMTNAGRYTKDPDLFLVKWEGYDDLTWEPEANIPNRIITFFRERENAKVQCGYQIDKFHKRKVVKNTTTGHNEVLYLIQWKGLPQAYWEVKTTLPTKVQVWLEKTSIASHNKSTLAGPTPRKKAKT